MIEAEKSKSTLATFTYIQTCMIVLFTCELICKMIAFGLITYFTMSIFNDVYLIYFYSLD